MPRPDTPRADLLPGTLEMLILRTLDVEPMHGYGIAQHIRKLSKDALTIEEGSLYPALQRMLIKGWVTAAWKTSPTKRRTRVYTLTAAGRTELGVQHANFNAMFAALSRVMRG
jgi:transcriptional regulator